MAGCLIYFAFQEKHIAVKGRLEMCLADIQFIKDISPLQSTPLAY